MAIKPIYFITDTNIIINSLSAMHGHDRPL